MILVREDIIIAYSFMALLFISAAFTAAYEAQHPFVLICQ